MTISADFGRYLFSYKRNSCTNKIHVYIDLVLDSQAYRVKFRVKINLTRTTEHEFRLWVNSFVRNLFFNLTLTLTLP